MPVGATIGAASIVGGGISAYGATKAAGIQADASGRAIEAQTAMFNAAQKKLDPFINTGKSAMYSLASLYGLPDESGQVQGGAFNDNALEAFRKSPDYAWRFAEGGRALDFSNAARGMLQSSDHLRSTVQYGQGMAGQGFGDYANRLLALSQIGAGSAGQAAGIGTQQGQIIGNSMMAQGQAQASGVVGATNAISGGISNGVNGLLMYNALNRPSAYSGQFPMGQSNAPSYPNPQGGSWYG